jgi:hypothetical protein
MAVDRSCPSFSWSLIAGMGSELVVVELDESTPASHTPDLEPVLHIRLPAGSSSWTPPGRQCLAAGRYAWYVRTASATGVGDWSRGLAFEVLPSPRDQQIELLLERIEALERRASSPSREHQHWTLPAGLPTPTPATIATAEAPPSAAEELDGIAEIKATSPASAIERYAILGISYGAHKDAAGVAGENVVATGRTVGVLGFVSSNEGVAVRGINSATTASGTDNWATGVSGHSRSPQGIGVMAQAESQTGQNVGVAGVTQSPDGWGGIFINEGGGSLIAATGDNTDLDNLPFEVENDGTTHIGGDMHIDGSTHIGALLTLTPFDAIDICDSSSKGWVYFDESVNELCFCNGAAWSQVDGGGACT